MRADSSFLTLSIYHLPCPVAPDASVTAYRECLPKSALLRCQQQLSLLLEHIYKPSHSLSSPIPSLEPPNQDFSFSNIPTTLNPYKQVPSSPLTTAFPINSDPSLIYHLWQRISRHPMLQDPRLFLCLGPVPTSPGHVLVLRRPREKVWQQLLCQAHHL